MSLKWKEAATVILTSVRTRKEITRFNYDLLSIKRSAKNSFMPGTHVFPGGATHDADSSKKWLEIFSKFNVKFDSKLDGTIPPILLGSVSDFPKLTAMKITAIRETFEETGIILCKKADKSNKWISTCCVQDLKTWRSNVEKNAYEFINLCEHFNCCPDINNLHLWCNWLTPKTKPKRFDTLFFVACLGEIPEGEADKGEIDEIMWHTPEELLQQNEKGLIILPPPQLYEISRLLHFNDCNNLLDFAKERASQGCEQWMPQYYKASDGLVSILPGDDAYKVNDRNGSNVPLPVIEMTKEEFKSKFNKLHRFEDKKIVVKNYSPKNGHVLPISLPAHL